MRNWGVPMLTPHQVVISFEARVGLGRRRSTLILLVVTAVSIMVFLRVTGFFMSDRLGLSRYWRRGLKMQAVEQPSGSAENGWLVRGLEAMRALDYQQALQCLIKPCRRIRVPCGLV